MSDQNWYVYLGECADGTYYCGIAVNVEERIAIHNSGKGSKYVSGKGGIKKLVWSIPVRDRSEASKVEYQVKQLSKERKARFKYAQNPDN